MFDFVFQNPTKIVFGKDKETKIGKELSNYNIKKVLLIYGTGSIKKSGLYDRVITCLKEAEIEVAELAGIVSNPVLSDVRKGVTLAKTNQVDAVLAVGGGSVIDTAKAVAAGAKSEADVWEFFIGKPIKEALPIFTILTLAATGSEMNSGAVVTNEETKQKYPIHSTALYPKVSILNPQLTCTVPANYSAYSAVDAFAHVIETYFTKEKGATINDRLVETVIHTVIDTNKIIKEDPNNYEARAEFMWAATLALNGITTVGTKGGSFPNHMIEHSLSAIYNVAHGAGLSIVIPAWMKWYKSKNLAQFERYAKEIFGLDSADAGIEATEEWFRELGSPVRLSEMDIPEKDIPAIIENVSDMAKSWGAAKTYTQEVIEEILRLAL